MTTEKGFRLGLSASIDLLGALHKVNGGIIAINRYDKTPYTNQQTPLLKLSPDPSLGLPEPCTLWKSRSTATLGAVSCSTALCTWDSRTCPSGTSWRGIASGRRGRRRSRLRCRRRPPRLQLDLRLPPLRTCRTASAGR